GKREELEFSFTQHLTQSRAIELITKCETSMKVCEFHLLFTSSFASVIIEPPIIDVLFILSYYKEVFLSF
ncbi:hypothetical protein, partial [Salibacterium salarium]|uniref:hypothetical protein n=1 Tax=Salibacterium salarium TaxID=284579 RepID=UPI001C8C4DCC